MIIPQDGAPLPKTRIVQDLFDAVATNSWTGRGGPANWSEFSLALMSYDIFLYGYARGKFYRPSSHRLNGLRRKNPSAIQSISKKILGNLWRNLNERHNAIIREDRDIVKLYNIDRDFNSWGIG